ncbi:MAG: protein kinase [Planctomycetota bacterium]|nr:protein kinase [Planctomycetota bacterium]
MPPTLYEQLYVGQDALRVRAYELPGRCHEGVVFDDGRRPGIRILHDEPIDGGTSVVFKAEKTIGEGHRLCALKVLLSEAPEGQGRDRWNTELSVLLTSNKLDGVPSVWEAGIMNGMPVLLMDWIDGCTLDEYANDNGWYGQPADGAESAKRIAAISHIIACLVQIVESVHQAKQEGHIHRDLKPSNIMVTMNKEKVKVIVLDFGEASLIESASTRGLTPLFASPEQVFEGHVDAPGHGKVDSRADQYAIGAMLQRFLAPISVWMAKAESKVATLRVFDRCAFQSLRDLSRRMTSREPSDRFKSLDLAGKALSRVQNPKLNWLSTRVLSWRTVALTSIACLAVLLGLIVLDGGQQTSPPLPAVPIVSDKLEVQRAVEEVWRIWLGKTRTDNFDSLRMEIEDRAAKVANSASRAEFHRIASRLIQLARPGRYTFRINSAKYSSGKGWPGQYIDFDLTINGIHHRIHGTIGSDNVVAFTKNSTDFYWTQGASITLQVERQGAALQTWYPDVYKSTSDDATLVFDPRGPLGLHHVLKCTTFNSDQLKCIGTAGDDGWTFWFELFPVQETVE